MGKIIPWTQEQIDLLTTNYGKKPIKEVSDLVGRSECACKMKAVELGLSRKNTAWTEEDIKTLQNLYGKVPVKEIEEKTGHPAKSCKGMAKKLGLTKPRLPPWTPEEDKRLVDLLNTQKENGQYYSCAEISIILGRNRDNVQDRAKFLGVKSKRAAVPLSQEQLDYLKKNYGVKKNREIADAIGISEKSIRGLASRYGIKSHNRPSREWSEEDLDYLDLKWGEMPITSIADKLHRTVAAVRAKACQLGLGSLWEAGDRISLVALVRAIQGSDRNDQNFCTKLVKAGLPVRRQKIVKKWQRTVDIDQFWKWAKDHTTLLDFSNMEEGILGAEPKWAKKKRKQDQQRTLSVTSHGRFWTTSEDYRLSELYNSGKYTASEIGELMGRTTSATKHRAKVLGLDCSRLARKPDTPWEEEELQDLAEAVKQYDTWNAIGEAVGRDETSCRNKAAHSYGTCDILKLRKLMGDDGWRSEEAVRAFLLTRKRTTRKKEVAKLCHILSAIVERNSAPDFDQRGRCAHWDTIKGCTLNQEKCEICLYFEHREKLLTQKGRCVFCGRPLLNIEHNGVCCFCAEKGFGLPEKKRGRPRKAG